MSQNELFERIAELAELAEKMDNHAAASVLPMPSHIHLSVLRDVITDTRDEFRSIYTQLTGDDPWAE